MLFDGVGNGQQQDIRQWVFDGCSDRVRQRDSTAMVAKIALNGGGSCSGLRAGSSVTAVVDNKDVF
jgi:hypothetical protein